MKIAQPASIQNSNNGMKTLQMSAKLAARQDEKARDLARRAARLGKPLRQSLGLTASAPVESDPFRGWTRIEG